MRKSLFSKIFLVQIVVALTVIAIIIPTTFVLVGDYFVSTQKDDVLQDAIHVSELSERVSDISASDKSWEMFKLGIEFVADDSIITILNSEGHTIASSKNSAGINLYKIDDDFVKEVKNGKRVVKLYNRGDIFPAQTIVAISPIMKMSKTNATRSYIGAVVAMRTIPQISYIRYRIFGIILFAQSVAWLLAFIISFFLTRHITKPFKQMHRALKSISSGNFKERIKITSKDEIGYLAESINSMSESLDELESMRTSFISDVSHELRTPMTIITGFVEGILDGTIPEDEHKKYLGIVLSETKRLNRLVHDLLESSRLEQGKVNLNKTNVDLNRLVTESVISYEQRLTEKKINVELNLEDGGLMALADRDSIKRVLLNLIDNAIKFTPEGGSIILKTQYEDKKAVTSIENIGAGIPKEDLKHIWERFYKSDKSRSMDKMGVGLGLHIVKKIISNHGGKIYAESEEGKFARFVFMLDRA